MRNVGHYVPFSRSHSLDVVELGLTLGLTLRSRDFYYIIVLQPSSTLGGPMGKHEFHWMKKIIIDIIMWFHVSYETIIQLFKYCHVSLSTLPFCFPHLQITFKNLFYS